MVLRSARRSRKENEPRLAIHPLHVARVEAGVRRRIYLERGYGERFGVPDEQLARYVPGLRTWEQLLADCHPASQTPAGRPGGVA